MAHDFCSWLWSPGYGPEHPIAHAHHFRDQWPPSGVPKPRWAFPHLASGPCCEFCKVSSRIPGLGEILVDLGHILPPIVHSIFDIFHNIHHHYQLGLDPDGEQSFILVREIEGLSRYVRKLYRAFPHMIELALWADQLKCMGRDIQNGPRRLQFKVMPKNRHNRILIPQNVW